MNTFAWRICCALLSVCAAGSAHAQAKWAKVVKEIGMQPD